MYNFRKRAKELLKKEYLCKLYKLRQYIIAYKNKSAP